jgi:hypothetical protein
MYESARLELLAGATEPVDTPSNSGKGQRILRCTRCRVALWSHYAGAGDAVAFVRVGALETPGELPPDVHIFTETKLPWVRLPDDVPSFEAYYPVKEYWPAPPDPRSRCPVRLAATERRRGRKRCRRPRAGRSPGPW